MKLDRNAPGVQCQYGFGWRGLDPRNFDPDRESCTPQELAAHAAAVADWERAESEGIDLCEHNPPPGEPCSQHRHAGGGSWGIGTYWFVDDEEEGETE